MAVYYSWALTKYVEEDGKVNEVYPCICAGNDIWCWDSIREAIEYRVEKWGRYWSEGSLLLIQYCDDTDVEIKTFSDAECFRCYNEWRKS
jgi:hypothetical protein